MDKQVNDEEISPQEVQTAIQIAKELVVDIKANPSLKPHQFIKKYWDIYKSNYQSNQNLNGKVFEELIARALIREDILPFYIQAKVAFIAYINYDFIIYTNDLGPVSLSAKTSLRERWKQADLEAVALKYIHRKSRSFVVTLDTEAVRRRRVDESQAMGIDSFVLADTEEFDETLEEIKKLQLALSPQVEVVSSSIIITADNYKERFSK